MLVWARSVAAAVQGHFMCSAKPTFHTLSKAQAEAGRLAHHDACLAALEHQRLGRFLPLLTPPLKPAMPAVVQAVSFPSAGASGLHPDCAIPSGAPLDCECQRRPDDSHLELAVADLHICADRYDLREGCLQSRDHHTKDTALS